MNLDLTEGNITTKLLGFSFPLMIGNLLQQLYNVADTLIVGRFLGADALAAVGSAYTLMTFLTSVLLGLCMGSGAYFAIQYGKKDYDSLNNGSFLSFLMIGAITAAISIFVYAEIDWIIKILQVPTDIVKLMKRYLLFVFAGIFASFLYNFFANLLRAIGNSVIPLLFLGVSAVLNIVLDLLFVITFEWGVAGAAIATVIAQYLSGIGIMIYLLCFFPRLCVKKQHMKWNGRTVKELFSLSGLTCLQQSVMNFGILMVQGLVNSFGTVVMAAFAAAVKIDSFAYMPVQDFGNAFSTFVAQNYGAGKEERIQKGIRNAVVSVFVFCLIISLGVCLFAEPLMHIFIEKGQTEIISVGVGYLRIEASFYFGIGLLFLLYGYYRAVKKPGMSLILTICSLGTRVLLAFLLSGIPALGVTGIWMSVPIGWLFADIVGVIYYFIYEKRHCINAGNNL